MPQFTLVDEPDSIIRHLGNNDKIGIDTEFMREKTFYAELCLVQIAAAETIYCVDPMNGNGIDAFWDALMADTWVVHSGRQDIEVIYQSAGKMPQRIFDTQIAAGLLGFAPQLGYASLVSELFDVEIDKSHTRANWSRRPLAEKYLEYAAEDVEYLLPAYDELARRLDDKGRRAWAEEDSMQLLEPALYDMDPDQAIQRLKGARNLRGKKRAAAARLAAWREAEAMRANRPRQWIAKDAALLDVAHAMPGNLDELAKIDSLPAGLVRRSGKELLKALRESKRDGDHHRPPAAPNESQKTALKEMQKHVADVAGELGIAAETLASKRELSAVIIGGERDSRLLNGWRHDLIGDELEAHL